MNILNLLMHTQLHVCEYRYRCTNTYRHLQKANEIKISAFAVHLDSMVKCAKCRKVNFEQQQQQQWL